jgi:hypothetical protein
LKKIINKEHDFKKNKHRLTYELKYKDVVDILEIIDHSTHGELHLELEDLKLTVVKRAGDALSATAKSLEVGKIQRYGMTTKNEAPSSIKEKDDSEKGESFS